MTRFFRRFTLSPQAATALNLAAIQGFFWFAWAFGCYGTVYLQQNGFPASSIGSLNALCSTVAIFAMMFWGMLSDRINSIKKTFLIALTGCALFHGLVPFLPTGTPYTVVLFFIFYPFVNLFRCSMGTLLDNLTVRTCAETRVNYGIVRSLGSFTFTLGSLLIVSLIPFTGIGSTFWLSGLLMIPAIISLCFAHDPRRVVKPAEKKIRISPKPLLKNYFYMSFMVFTAIIYVALSAEFSFLSYFMADIGIESTSLGSFLAVRAFMEIPLLIIIVKLRAKLKLKYLIMFACSLMAAECLLLGLFASSLGAMLVFGAIFGLGNGVFLGTVSLYLYKLAPENLKASAQTIFAAVSSISGILGNLVGGFAYEALGSRVFYFALGLIIISGVIFFIISLITRKNLKNPGDIMG